VTSAFSDLSDRRKGWVLASVRGGGKRCPQGRGGKEKGGGCLIRPNSPGTESGEFKGNIQLFAGPMVFRIGLDGRVSLRK